MKNFLKRIWPFIAISLSVIILVFCIGGIIGIWIVEKPVSSATVQILGAVEISSQTLRDGIAGVDDTVEKLEKPINALETSSQLISQKIEDKGLLLTILPATKEKELSTAAQSVQEKLASILDFMDSIKEMVQAVNALPFIDLRSDGLASAKTLEGRIDGMMTFVGELNVGIGEIRSQTSNNISIITNSAARLSDLLAELRSDLAVVDSELSAIQDQAIRWQNLMPKIILSSAIVATLLALWVGHSQVMMINSVIRYPRTLIGSKETNKKGNIADDLASEKTLQGRIDEMMIVVGELKVGISEICLQTSDNISKISNSAAGLSNLLSELHSDLTKEIKSKAKKTPSKTVAKPAAKKPVSTARKPAARKRSASSKPEKK